MQHNKITQKGLFKQASCQVSPFYKLTIVLKMQVQIEASVCANKQIKYQQSDL